MIPVEACVCGGDTAKGGPGDEADIGVEVRDEAVIVIAILVIDANLKPQTDSGLPAGASADRDEVAAKQEGVEDPLPLFICPKSGEIVLLLIIISSSVKNF